MLKKKLILLGIFILCFVSITNAQYGSRYMHVDTLQISTTERDTTWTVPWELVTFYTDTVAINIKVGAPDIDSWATRTWLYLENGAALTIGPAPNLKRLTVKTVSGTGVLYLIGYKRSKQQ